MLTGLPALEQYLARTSNLGDLSADVKRLINELNNFLSSCTEYPQLFIGGARHERPRAHVQFVPGGPGPMRRSAISENGESQFSTDDCSSRLINNPVFRVHPISDDVAVGRSFLEAKKVMIRAA